MSRYQPQSTDGLADWWENIKENGTPHLTAAGILAAEITAIMNDAQWAEFAYATLRNLYESYHQTIIAYADRITYGPIDGAIGPGTPPPAFPTLPSPVVLAGVERRREKWVQDVKNSLTYTQAIGEGLRIVAPEAPFDFANYTAVLSAVKSQSPRTVSGRFRKAYGNVDGVAVYGRKEGTTLWIELGRFTAIPFTANVPLTGTSPEVWEFQVRAFRRDQLFGNPSAIHQATILP